MGIYGAVTNEEICTEESPAENDFLGITCQKWEAASDKITSLGIRTVKIRTGIVLGKKDGFLKKLNPGFKAGFGTILGTGKQYLPWIHVEDLCNIYLKAIQDEQINGVYNATVLDNTSNETLSKTLANLYGYTIWLPKIPAFVLRLFLGEMSQVVLNGQRVSSEKIKQRGFKFRFKNLKAALSDCLS